MRHTASRELEYILESDIRPVHKLSVFRIFSRRLCMSVCLPVYNRAQCPMEDYARACVRLFLRHYANRMKWNKPVFRFFFAFRESLSRRMPFNGKTRFMRNGATNIDHMTEGANHTTFDYIYLCMYFIPLFSVLSLALHSFISLHRGEEIMPAHSSPIILVFNRHICFFFRECVFCLSNLSFERVKHESRPFNQYIFGWQYFVSPVFILGPLTLRSGQWSAAIKLIAKAHWFVDIICYFFM